ncbi:MAG: hypothetical protein CMF72_22750 [Mameliella sp.]|nr:hypothetical protein [Mameliella sp.]
MALASAMSALRSHLNSAPMLPLLPIGQPRGPQPRVRRYRTGLTYPHSSTRQRTRYARQINAGQLKMEIRP